MLAGSKQQCIPQKGNVFLRTIQAKDLPEIPRGSTSELCSIVCVCGWSNSVHLQAARPACYASATSRSDSKPHRSRGQTPTKGGQRSASKRTEWLHRHSVPWIGIPARQRQSETIQLWQTRFCASSRRRWRHCILLSQRLRWTSTAGATAVCAYMTAFAWDCHAFAYVMCSRHIEPASGTLINPQR